MLLEIGHYRILGPKRNSSAMERSTYISIARISARMLSRNLIDSKIRLMFRGNIFFSISLPSQVLSKNVRMIVNNFPIRASGFHAVALLTLIPHDFNAGRKSTGAGSQI